MKLLISPHDDDSALFAAFTCQREHPLICVALNSYIQPNRGERGCSAEERARETLCAHSFFRCNTVRLGIRDDLELARIEDEVHQGLSALLIAYDSPVDTIYAPAVQGGNPHHDLIGKMCVELFADKVVQYTTYTKTELYTTGNVEIVPTERELTLKNRALQCYESQLRINRPHFDAVMGRSEWLM